MSFLGTGKYELVVVWDNGDYGTETEVFEYKTREDAEHARTRYFIMFGNQIQWAGVREQLRK